MLGLAAAITVPVVEIISDIGIASIVHTGISTIAKPTAKNLVHKGCIYAGEGMLIGLACDKANESFEKGVDMCLDFIIDHGWDEKILGTKSRTRKELIDG